MKQFTFIVILLGLGLLPGCLTISAIGTGLTAVHIAINDAHKLEELILKIRKLEEEKVKPNDS